MTSARPPGSLRPLRPPGSRVRRSSARRIAGTGLALSPTTEVLLEESIFGWKEYELELMRDKN
ncbi:hypothetical protein, partial [Catenulispora rubra]|uniref:hypothetical protein n=1 Tax=Catenulispora rubra TaxID=280293 RepID=UPI001891F6E0